jgi:apolipoprotein N-acyltransferase
MKIFIAQKWLLELCLGSIAYVLCFPEWNLPYFSVLVLFFFVRAIDKLETLKQSLMAALLFSTAIAIGGFSWIVYTVQNFGGFPLPIALLFLIAYCFIAAPHAYVFFALGQRYKREIANLPLAVQLFFWPAFFVALEYLAHFVKIFPEHLGNTLIYFLPLAQNASWGGVSVLSFIPLFLGLTFHFALIKKSRAAIGLIVCAIAITAGAWIGGAYTLAKLETATPTQQIKFSIIQANIGDIDKVVSVAGDREAIRRVIQKYLDMSEQAASQGAELILWPETAYPISFPTDPEQRHSNTSLLYAASMKARVEKIGVPILFGGYERKNGSDYNSMILLGEDTRWQGSYRKEMLLMFGEYMPFGDYFPYLKTLNPQMGDFGRGPGPIPVEWTRKDKPPLLLGINICYEAIMPAYMQRLAKNGAQIFINATNDSWFGPTAEPWQHLQLAQMQTIANRLPMVRATNTGISTAISFTGRMMESGPLFEEAIVSVTVLVPTTPIPSLYREWGDWFAQVLLICSILVLGLAQAKRTR